MNRFNLPSIRHRDEGLLTAAIRRGDQLSVYLKRRKLIKQYGSKEAIPAHLWPLTMGEHQLMIFQPFYQMMHVVALEMSFIPDFSPAYVSMGRLAAGDFQQYTFQELQALATTQRPYYHCYQQLLSSSSQRVIAGRLNKYKKHGGGVAGFETWLHMQDEQYQAACADIQKQYGQPGVPA